MVQHTDTKPKPTFWNDTILVGAAVGGIVGGVLLSAVAIIASSMSAPLSLPIGMAIILGGGLMGGVAGGFKGKKNQEHEQEQEAFSRAFDATHGLDKAHPYTITPEESRLLESRLSQGQQGSMVERLSVQDALHIAAEHSL